MDSTLASQLIEAQFPELSPVRVVRLGEGCDSTAFEVNRHWVFRFPKRRDVEEQSRIERRLLPILADRLPIPIPIFRFAGRSSPRFDREFNGYPRIAGVPAMQLLPGIIRCETLAGPIGAFLSALHAFPVDQARSVGVPEQRIAEIIEEVREDALAGFDAVAQAAPRAPLERWRRFLESDCGAGGVTGGVALVHNDFAAEHILMTEDGQAITGVIDWTDVAISEPEADFAGLFHWGGEPLARAVLEAYRGGLDEAAMVRARYMAACRGAMDVAFGVETRRPEYVCSGLQALGWCTAPR